jgi:ribosome-associated heat shock protein Hsp15
MSVRLDKWLQVARVYKTRSQATKACTLGRVKVNDIRAKPHRSLEIDDRVEVEVTRDWTRTLVVKVLKDRPVRKEEAALLFEDSSPPRPTLDPLERLMKRPPTARERGLGRPTKRDRRKIDRFRLQSDDE